MWTGEMLQVKIGREFGKAKGSRPKVTKKNENGHMHTSIPLTDLLLWKKQPKQLQWISFIFIMFLKRQALFISAYNYCSVFSVQMYTIWYKQKDSILYIMFPSLQDCLGLLLVCFGIHLHVYYNFPNKHYQNMKMVQRANITLISISS